MSLLAGKYKNSAYKKIITNTQKSKDSLLRIEKVSKTFKDVIAVDSINLQINKGEIFALLGGSGSGKSTLLRMLAGFETPTDGKIFLDNEDITNLPPYKRPVNMMFQSYALFPHMTVQENIAFGLKQDKLSKEEIDLRVNQMLKLVHMEQFIYRKPHQLSGGQKQRAALARSLAKQPKLLLLDEPMGALDKKLRSQMQLELIEIIENVGVTCVMVTHDQEEAMTMAERVAIMRHGYIEQVGSPIDIYETPASKFVCEFIGNVNLFEGQIIEDENDHAIISCSALDKYVYIGHGVSVLAEDKKVTYAIRPEKIRISIEKPTDLEHENYNWTTGIIDDIAYLGGHSVYYIKLASGQIVQGFMANSDRFAQRPTWEQNVYISWFNDAGVVLQL